MNEGIDRDVIIAQATPRGNGAIALLRLSGKDVKKIISCFIRFPNQKTINDFSDKSIQFGHIIDKNNEIVDDVLFFIMDGPKTFTGENVIEITCHNNNIIIEKIIELACSNGARRAQPGEFSKRAVINKKIDVLQAEAIHDLINAQNEYALKSSLEQLHGSLSHSILFIDEQLCLLSAWIQASFEFLDEERDFTKDIVDLIDSIALYCQNLIDMYDKQKIIRDGFKISLLGSVNAGKSSLFNSLIEKNRAIVTPIEGTTRDVIEYTVYKNGINITFFDTAGIRETEDVIEQEGIKRSYESANQSDLILLVYDLSYNYSKEMIGWYDEIIKKYKNKLIFVNNKFDIKKNINVIKINSEEIKSFDVSVNNNEMIEVLKNELYSIIQYKINNAQASGLINLRHIDILSHIIKKLITIKSFFDHSNVYYEIVMIHINECLQLISDMTGKSCEEKSLDKVFKQFCVGK